MRFIDRIIIHSSATPPEMDVGVATIRRWHLNRGWSDIGYHYVIRRNGEIEEGRPLDRVGAHAKGHNTGSIGICMVGGLDGDGRAQDNFRVDQYLALRTLVVRLQAEYPIVDVLGHRDLPNVRKDCPCFDAREYFGGQTGYDIPVGRVVQTLTRGELERLHAETGRLLAALPKR